MVDDSDFEGRLAARLGEHAQGVGMVGGVPLEQVRAAGRRRVRRVRGAWAGAVLMVGAVCTGALLQLPGGTTAREAASVGVGQAEAYRIPPQDCSYDGLLMRGASGRPVASPGADVTMVTPEPAEFVAVQLATAVDKLGEQYPDNFRGTCWDGPKRTVYALRTQGSGFDAKATALAAERPGVTLKLVDQWPWEAKK
ncbi:hypothetical protein GCM10010440_71050 [Kitasatospora cinereorecta]